MPVSLERLTSPLNAQDVIDVNKIISESGELWRSDAPSNIWEENDPIGLLPSKIQCMGGRFNDHLIGLVLLESDTNGYKILGVCVRPLTRERSVASQMLLALTRVADREQKHLKVSKRKMKEAPFLVPTLESLGFQQDNTHWNRVPDNRE